MPTIALIANGLVAKTLMADLAIDVMPKDYAAVDITAMSPQPGIGWSYDGQIFSPPNKPSLTAEQQSSLVSLQCSTALTKSDETMLRIQEAVSLGLTTWTTQDVVDYVNYRRALRSTQATGKGSILEEPPFPAGT